MTILSATLVREEDGEHSEGISHKDPVVNLVKCDESRKTGEKKEAAKKELSTKEQVVSCFQIMSYKEEESIAKAAMDFLFSCLNILGSLQYKYADSLPATALFPYTHVYTHLLHYQHPIKRISYCTCVLKCKPLRRH